MNCIWMIPYFDTVSFQWLKRLKLRIDNPLTNFMQFCLRCVWIFPNDSALTWSKTLFQFSSLSNNCFYSLRILKNSETTCWKVWRTLWCKKKTVLLFTTWPHHFISSLSTQFFGMNGVGKRTAVRKRSVTNFSNSILIQITTFEVFKSALQKRFSGSLRHNREQHIIH